MRAFYRGMQESIFKSATKRQPSITAVAAQLKTLIKIDLIWLEDSTHQKKFDTYTTYLLHFISGL